METRYIQADIEKDADSFIAVASTATVDRHGESISQDGWELNKFKKNPVILWGHDHSEPAIGTASKVWVEGEGKRAKLMANIKLHDVTEKARAIKSLVEQGILKTLSVGFRPLEDMVDNTFPKQELLEISVVNVPANPDAQMLAYKSLKQDGVSGDTMKELGIADSVVKMFEEVDKRFALIEAKLDSAVKGLTHLAPQGRSHEDVTTKLSLSKAIARSADKMHADGIKARDVRVIKRAAELLIVDLKKEINPNGKN